MNRNFWLIHFEKLNLKLSFRESVSFCGVFAPIEHFVRSYGLFWCSQQSFNSKRIQLNSIWSNSIIFWWLPHHYWYTPKIDANMHCNKVREYKLEINYGNTFHIWPVWSVWEKFRYIKIHGTTFCFASIESQTHEKWKHLQCGIHFS